MCNLENFRKNAASQSISCEIVGGHVVQSEMTGEDGHKLCFLLGTMMEDYLLNRKKTDQVLFGPVDFHLDESNIFQPDLAVVEQSESYRGGMIRTSELNKIPKLIVEVLADGNAIYDCLDKAVLYGKNGVREYWLIDLNEEFVYSDAEIQLIDAYSDLTDELHTDLHECLGHGSGKLLPGVDPDALKAYGSTIEEARADLFGLYYVADPKLVELGLLSSPDAYKAQYYTYLMNGLMTQLVRIEPGNSVEEAHMRNRQLIARWVFEKGAADKAVELVKKDGKTYVVINDYQKVRQLFGELLAEIQRIKSTGDFEGARTLVENYAVKVDPALHAEVLERYKKLNLAPYKGFVNPKYELVTDENGTVTDVTVSYDEGYVEQMLRYSTDYSPLPSINN